MFILLQIILLSFLPLKITMTHLDFRERFLERKRLRQIENPRITGFNGDAVNKDIEVLNDITHYRDKGKNSSEKWIRARAIEKDFRRMLAMDGVKYNYKRDMYWRTWRSVTPVNGGKEIICYKCNNLQINGTECQNCGMWTIEERPPPCPYEFFSVITNQDLCGINYTQYKDVNATCASVIKFSDLTATCDNPIETEWRFSKLYGVTEEYDKVICGGKDFCEILTSYEITPDHVIFRIINSTNDVMYSRIMKPNHTNYICVKDCGRFSVNTRRVGKSDIPLKLDLLAAGLPEKDGKEDTLNLNEMNAGMHHPTPDETQMSNYGGNDFVFGKEHERNHEDEQNSKSKVIKRHQNNLDFKKDSSDTCSSGNKSPGQISKCQKLKKKALEAELISYEDENENEDVEY